MTGFTQKDAKVALLTARVAALPRGAAPWTEMDLHNTPLGSKEFGWTCYQYDYDSNGGQDEVILALCFIAAMGMDP